MLTLLSAATLSASSVMALSLYYPIAAVSRMAPSEIECRLENEGEITAIKQFINKYSSDADVTFIQTDIYKVTSAAGQLPMEYSIGTSKGDADNEKILRNAGFECIPYSNSGETRSSPCFAACWHSIAGISSYLRRAMPGQLCSSLLSARSYGMSP